MLWGVYRRMYYEVEDCGVEEGREGSLGYGNPWEDLRWKARRGKRRKWSMVQEDF